MHRLPHVGIITSGYLPVPNVLGGAVEALDMMLLRENEKRSSFNFTIYSTWTEGVEDESKNFDHARFEFVKTPWFVKFADSCVYAFAKYVLRKKKLMSYRYIMQRLWYIGKVAKKLSNEDLDAILIENHATLFMVMKKRGNAKRYKGRVYYHLHNELTGGFGCLREISQVHKVLGVSRYIVNTLDDFLNKETGSGLVESQKAVWRNCVDTERFNPKNELTQQRGKDFRRKLDIPENSTVLLFSGRLTQEKGAEELLEAFLLADAPNTILVIVGAFFYNSNIQSPFEQKLAKIAQQANDRIRFTGFVDYADMPAIYAMSDICCLPSIWNDPAPLAVIEALASGKPLITTKSGGIPEYADDQAAVILEKDENLVSNLSSAIKNLAADPKKREDMGRHGRLLSEGLSASAYLEQLIALFKD